MTGRIVTCGVGKPGADLAPPPEPQASSCAIVPGRNDRTAARDIPPAPKGRKSIATGVSPWTKPPPAKSPEGAKDASARRYAHRLEAGATLWAGATRQNRFASATLLLACAIAILCATSVNAQLTLTPEADLQGGLEQYDRAVEIQAAEPDEARRLFLSAAKRWSRIAAGGIADKPIASGPLEFNIGNAYLQAGDTGRAILHYRRAQRLIPGDAYLQNNLESARDRRLSPIKATRQSGILRSVFFIHYAVSGPARARAAIIAFALIWVFLLIRLFTLHRPALIGALLSLIVAASLGISVGVESWSQRRTPEGVVTEMDVVAFQGPGTGYKRKFVEPLQPGLEFTRLQRRGDWQQIQLPDAQTGWIRIDQAELIAG